MSLFRRALFLTDLHFGRNCNNPIANQDNLDFLDWAIDRGHSFGADTLIFGGDWFDNRYSIQLSTMHYSLQGIEKIKPFKNIYWIVGNHDLYHREKRDISSIEFLKFVPNITVINDPMTLDDVTFLPWLIPNEIDEIKNLKSRYVFGHLEMPGFKMNDKVVLADTQNLVRHDQFLNQEFCFLGHFHLRQTEGKIIYTGNVMPFNFSDDWDEDRGIMLLEWGKDPIFESWNQQPVYRTTKLSELMANPNSILRPKATIRAVQDISLHFEEAAEIKASLEQEYDLRKLELLPLESHDSVDQEFKNEKIAFKSVDQMVLDGITSVESVSIDVIRLVEMYRELIE